MENEQEYEISMGAIYIGKSVHDIALINGNSFKEVGELIYKANAYAKLVEALKFYAGGEKHYAHTIEGREVLYPVRLATQDEINEWAEEHEGEQIVWYDDDGDTARNILQQLGELDKKEIDPAVEYGQKAVASDYAYLLKPKSNNNKEPQMTPQPNTNTMEVNITAHKMSNTNYVPRAAWELWQTYSFKLNNFDKDIQDKMSVYGPGYEGPQEVLFWSIMETLVPALSFEKRTSDKIKFMDSAQPFPETEMWAVGNEKYDIQVFETKEEANYAYNFNRKYGKPYKVTIYEVGGGV